MTLDSDIQNILELSNESSSARSRAFEKLKQLQEKVKGGESTGDRIKNFVIVNLGSLSPDAEKPYRETEARCRECVGSQILVVKQNESIHGCPGIVPPQYIDPMFIGINTELILGVLTSGLELDIGGGKIIFPTDRHARKYDKYSRGKWELEEGPISISWYDFANLGKEVHRRRTPMPSDLSARFEHGLMLHLGEEVEQYFGGSGRLDTSYVEALNLLGREAPERFRKKHDKGVYQAKVGVINKLEELTRREARLNSEIESIYNSMRHGGFERGGAFTMVRDADDVRVVSMGPRMKLEGTREEIQRCLERGIELEMHKGDLRIEQKPGIEINVPAYISGMCEKYGVDIPK